MKTKKLLSTLLTLTMIISMLSGFSLVANAAENLADSTTGITLIPNDDGYYQIGTADELIAFANLVNAGNTTLNAVLTADITVNTKVLNADGTLVSDVSGLTVWTPIGNSSQKYAGSFDGNNKTVSGLYINKYATSSSAGESYIGLFGYANKATVKNLIVKDSFFGGYEWVGGIAGCFWGNGGYMENCVSYATVKAHQKVGGVSGGIQYADAENCHNHGLVTGSNHVGGFTGKAGYTSVFTNCSNTGTVKWISGSNGYFGGFVADASTSTGAFKNCFNSGDIIYSANNTMNKYIGGFVCQTKGTYENCYSNGTITVTNYTRVGSFAASTYSTPTITNCYYDNTKSVYGAVKNADYAGVTAKTSEQFKSGEVAYLLNGSSSAEDVVWKQTLATDDAPNFDGLIVYYDDTKYYNVGSELALTLTADDVKIENLSESAILIVASFKGDSLIDVKPVTVSTDCAKTIESIGLNLTDADTIKAFLWKDLSTITPLCMSKSVPYSDKTGEFDGEWVTI